MKEYNFSGYNNHEALFLTPEEKKTLEDLFLKAYQEYGKTTFSREVIVSYAALILSYISLFYKRQFDSRSRQYNQVVADFYRHSEEHISEKDELPVLPSVGFFAEKAFLSVNYFGDLIKHYTGQPPQYHIHQSLLQVAKRKLRQTTVPVSEIGYSLGFEYPTYFTRFFKKETGITPLVFRRQY